MAYAKIPTRLNPGDSEAEGLVYCMVAVPGGMMDLVRGTIGTRADTADPSRTNELGTLDAYFDGNADQYNFGSTPTVNIANDWTIVWESYLDAIGGGGGDTYPGVAIFARGASDPLRLGYSSDVSYDDIYVGTRSGTQSSFLLPSGITKTLQRHWGVLTSVGGTRLAWVNGQACTATTSGSLAVITDDTRVGGTSGTTSDWFGAIRQVRFYERAWSEDEAVRFFQPASRDSLFGPRRRRAYLGATTAVPNNGSGTASATGAATGQGYNLHYGSGSASATGTATGQGYNLHYGSGSATGVGSAVGEGQAPASAQGSGVATATGIAVGQGYRVSEGSGTATAVATAVGAGPDAVVATVTPGVKKRDPWSESPEVDWSLVARRVEASLERDRAQRREANKRKLLLLMAA